MQNQVNPSRPSEVRWVESLGARISVEDTECVWVGTEPARLAHRCSTSHPKWAATAAVLLAPNWELTEPDRQVKRRWQALIAEGWRLERS